MSLDQEQQRGLVDRFESVAAELAALRSVLYGFLELLVWAVLAAPVGIVLLVVDRPEGFVWPKIFDVAHVILSGVASLVALRLSRRLFGPVFRSARAHYVIAFAFSAFVGTALEAAQAIGPGDPSLVDLARDVWGAIAALVFALTFDQTVARARMRRVRWALRALSFALLLPIAYPVARVAWLVDGRKAVFPRLADFESATEETFVYAANGATLARIPPPRGFTHAKGRYVGQVTFPRTENPKLEIAGPLGDWSRARDLAFEVHSIASSTVTLSVRVDDDPTGGSSPRRFNTKLMIPPGESTQRIPIQEIRRGSEGGELDLARMKAVLLFRWEPEEPIVLNFDSVRLDY